MIANLQLLYADEGRRAFGAKTKARCEEARLLQGNLRKWLRTAIVFHAKLTPPQSPVSYEYALADVDRGLIAACTNLERPPWTRPRGNPSARRAKAIRDALRGLPGLRRSEADVLAQALLAGSGPSIE